MMQHTPQRLERVLLLQLARLVLVHLAVGGVNHRLFLRARTEGLVPPQRTATCVCVCVCVCLCMYANVCAGQPAYASLVVGAGDLPLPVARERVARRVLIVHVEDSALQHMVLATEPRLCPTQPPPRSVVCVPRAGAAWTCIGRCISHALTLSPSVCAGRHGTVPCPCSQ
jgi:hypothetical protein